MLASGLPEIVADDEDLARFLTSRSQFNAQMAKPAAFLPAVNDRETSVLQEVYDTERHLLYVACTRARDHLLVTGVDPVSEFVDDFTKGDQSRAQHG
jgi:ATP-dependent exoDNAse (exonuclease V) beta subunit